MTIVTSSMFASFLSALVGGIFTLAGVIIAHKISSTKQLDKESKQIHGYLRGVSDDIDCLWHLYFISAGEKLESLLEDDLIPYKHIAEQDYLSYFHGNITFLTKVESLDVRMSINLAYSHIKALLDSWRLHSELVQMYEEAYLLNLREPSEGNKNYFEITKIHLLNNTSNLRGAHNHCKYNIEELREELHKIGAMSEWVEPKKFYNAYKKKIFTVVFVIIISIMVIA
jgi:hypothetical protein